MKYIDKYIFLTHKTTKKKIVHTIENYNYKHVPALFFGEVLVYKIEIQ